MAGERTDFTARVMRAGLSGLSAAYRLAIRQRNHRYDRGRSKTYSVGVPVISVGNLTTGGTGKTPIVCWLARWLRDHGKRVAIVSRGYGRGDSDHNDEALELHSRLPDVPHVQDPDRVKAAQVAVHELAAEVVLMDDGFQHRRLHRNLDIVVIDATCPFGYDRLLPRGLLREPITSLRRADLVILSRTDSVDQQTVNEISESVRAVGADIPILQSIHQPTTLLDCAGTHHAMVPQNVAALSAIGNPAAFEKSLMKLGMNVVDAKRLPDHDPYNAATIKQLCGWIQTLGDRIDRVVCTHKDLVKLESTRLGGKPLAAVVIELQFCEEATPLTDRLARLITIQTPTLPANDGP